MKKLKLKLDAIHEEMDILELEDLRGIKGGYGGYGGGGGDDFYGYDTWELFVDAVEGGYVPAGVYYPDGGTGGYGGYGGYGGGMEDEWYMTVDEDGFEYMGAGYPGSPGDPYTIMEFDAMVANGTWNGGEVEGYGRIEDDVTVTAYSVGKLLYDASQYVLDGHEVPFQMSDDLASMFDEDYIKQFGGMRNFLGTAGDLMELGGIAYGVAQDGTWDQADSQKAAEFLISFGISFIPMGGVGLALLLDATGATESVAIWATDHFYD